MKKFFFIFILSALFFSLGFKALFAMDESNLGIHSLRVVTKREKCLVNEVDTEKKKEGVIASKPSQYHILVVEDDLTTQKIMVKILKTAGYMVILAEDGFQAVKKCEQEKVDCICMDVEMPGRNGIEVTRKIRQELKKTIPIIATTSLDIKDKYTYYGMNAYLQKPVSKKDLLSTIASILKTF